MIVLESCSNPQKIGQAFVSAIKKKFGVFSFFESNVISGVGLGFLAHFIRP